MKQLGLGVREASERLRQAATIEKGPRASPGRQEPSLGRLDAILRERGPLESWEVIYFITSIAAALDEAHGGGVVHGHVEPRNVVIDERGTARLVSSMGTDREQVDDERYMAPERAMGRRATRYADVYALGLVAYEMIAGRPAFANGADVARTRARIVVGAPRLGHEVPGVGRSVSTVVARATALDEADRYPTAGEFARELAKAVRASDPTELLTRPVLKSGRRPGRPNAARLALALPTALVLIGVFNVFGAFGQTRTATTPTLGASTVASSRANVATAPAKLAQGPPAAVAIRATPDVVGMSARDAARLLRDRGFRNDIEVIVDRSATGRARTVVRQEPVAGASFQQGQRARLFVVGPLDD